MVKERFGSIIVLVIATSLSALACETPTPESFDGNTDKPVGVGKSKTSDSKSKLDKAGDSEKDKKDPTPSPPATTTTPPKPAPVPVPECKSSASFELCVTCCDPTNVYPAFLAKLKACNGEATCEKGARDGCTGDKACDAADKCLLPNGCWDKKTDAEIAEAANPPAPEEP